MPNCHFIINMILYNFMFFCDYSNSAYATAPNSSFENTTANVNWSLVEAKTKIAPLSQMNIPRVEP